MGDMSHSKVWMRHVAHRILNESCHTGIPVGPEALPNTEFWRSVFESLMNFAINVKEKLQSMMGGACGSCHTYE